MAVSCALLAGIPVQKSMAQAGRTAKTQASQSNKITVTGTVMDKTTGDPLIGVSVVVKGVANTGTITDIDGKFTLKLPYAEAPLVFSYLGYQKLFRAQGKTFLSCCRKIRKPCRKSLS